MPDNFIDIHSHSLWGIDDGAGSIEQTIEMCEIAEECGTQILFLTPHLMYWNEAEDILDERDEKAAFLKNFLWENNFSIDIKTGFEILCDDDIFNVKYFKPYTLNGSRYILIEFDFFKTTAEDVKAWCKYLQSFGLVPIIAHPERYNFVMRNRAVLDSLSDTGVLFQINAGSPVGAFGDIEMSIACDMLRAGYVDFVGSDAHSINYRNTDMLSFFEDYPYWVGEEQMTLITRKNPLAIINDVQYTPKRIKYMSDL